MSKQRGGNRRAYALGVWGVVACGCGPRVEDAGGPGGGTTDEGESTGGDGEVVLFEEPLRQLDVLFVVDNSQSTAALGPKVADMVEIGISVLEAPDVRVDYRLAVTTTDSGNLMPVRLRALAEAFAIGEVELRSVCGDDFAEAFARFTFRSQIRPGCVPVCVADVDSSPGLQADCTVYELWTDGAGTHEVVLPPCGPGDALPADANACTVPLTDKDGATATVADDMTQECIDDGGNLELRIVRREGFPAAGGSTISIACQPSTDSSVDCPGLP